MKKGFTLIELLAVLIILAIIALISTPIVLNLISDSRKNAMKVSIEHYIDAIEAQVAADNVNTNEETLDGVYKISNEGKTLIRDENTILTLDYKGKGLVDGTVVIENGFVKQIIDSKLDEWYVKMIDGKIELSNEI